MIKIDLITGFLGSGKTTFIRNYAMGLMESGIRVGILENDYGAVNVDMLLLNDLRGDMCELEMVAGACDYDCHKRRFKTKLIQMAMSGYGRVIVEPSGIFDVDEFFDSIREEPLDNWYEPGNVIAVVDAALEEDMSEKSEYLLASQVAKSGLLYLSKTDLAKSGDVERTLTHINRALETIKCSRRVGESGYLAKQWSELTEEERSRVYGCSYVGADHVKMQFQEENDYSSLYYMNVVMTEDRLKEVIGRIFQDPECGKVFRIKGFMPVIGSEGQWLEINATNSSVSIAGLNKGQEVLIVIGEELNAQKINEYVGATDCRIGNYIASSVSE